MVESARRSRKKRFGWRGAILLLGGIGAGAAMMYLLDPARRRHRRDELWDAYAYHTASVGSNARIAAEAPGLAGDEDFPDEQQETSESQGRFLIS